MTDEQSGLRKGRRTPAEIERIVSEFGSSSESQPVPDMFRAPANVTGWLCVCSILSRGAAATPKVGAAQSAVESHRIFG